MESIREWSVPGFLIGAWVLVAAYTLSSLGETHAVVQKSLKVPAIEQIAPAPSRQAPLVTKVQKRVAHRGPRV